MYSAMTIVTIVVMIYFIKKQFEFEQVSKVRYYIIPIFGAFQFVTTAEVIKISDLLLLMSVFIISVLIGWYQTKDFQIVSKEAPTNYFVKEQGQEKQVYKKISIQKVD